MSQITLNNGLISYYGNPVGYTQKDRAVVDENFQNEGLDQWLKGHNLIPSWTEGVMEKLLVSGQTVGAEESVVPLKNVRIWQLHPETDVNKKFIGFTELQNSFGGIDPKDYHVVYDGQLGTNDLEAIFERCNTNHPPDYHGHSLSMSDVVELYNEEGSQFHYCDSFGFQAIDFTPTEQSIEMDYSMKQTF